MFQRNVGPWGKITLKPYFAKISTVTDKGATTAKSENSMGLIVFKVGIDRSSSKILIDRFVIGY